MDEENVQECIKLIRDHIGSEIGQGTGQDLPLKGGGIDSKSGSALVNITTQEREPQAISYRNGFWVLDGLKTIMDKEGYVERVMKVKLEGAPVPIGTLEVQLYEAPSSTSRRRR